jgi:hypothetical protein
VLLLDEPVFPVDDEPVFPAEVPPLPVVEPVEEPVDPPPRPEAAPEMVILATGNPAEEQPDAYPVPTNKTNQRVHGREQSGAPSIDSCATSCVTAPAATTQL